MFSNNASNDFTVCKQMSFNSFKNIAYQLIACNSYICIKKD